MYYERKSVPRACKLNMQCVELIYESLMYIQHMESY